LIDGRVKNVSVHVDPNFVSDGVRGVALENELIRATIFPTAGAKVLDFVHRASGTNLLWRNPRVPLAATYSGPAYDDVWCGGWDELFPTGDECEIDGNRFQDHGDLWCGPWEWSFELRDNAAILHLRRDAVAVPCRMEKWITLRDRSPELELRYRLTNLAPAPVPYSWHLHLAHPITPQTRLHLPAQRVAVQAPDFGRLPQGTTEAAWPRHGDHDLSKTLPPEAAVTEWLHTLDLHDGWCAVNHGNGVGLGLRFDSAVFPRVWSWGVYGGWRGHNVLITEPSTCPPGGLAAAARDGTAPRLDPSQVLETTVTAIAVEGVPGDLPGDVPPPGM
jgi:galactose mutarotase-like enzyme